MFFISHDSENTKFYENCEKYYLSKKYHSIEELGGRTYLAEILDAVPTAANAPKYAEIVIEKAILRQLLNAGSQIIKEAFEHFEMI